MGRRGVATLLSRASAACCTSGSRCLQIYAGEGVLQQEGKKVGKMLQHSMLQMSWTNGGRGYRTWRCNTSESGVAAFKFNVACKRAGKMGVDAALQHFRQVPCVAPAAVVAYRIS